jgi:hypothetical protein
MRRLPSLHQRVDCDSDGEHMLPERRDARLTPVIRRTPESLVFSPFEEGGHRGICARSAPLESGADDTRLRRANPPSAFGRSPPFQRGLIQGCGGTLRPVDSPPSKKVDTGGFARAARCSSRAQTTRGCAAQNPPSAFGRSPPFSKGADSGLAVERADRCFCFPNRQSRFPLSPDKKCDTPRRNFGTPDETTARSTKKGPRAARRRGARYAAAPTGQLTPVPPSPQYPIGFLDRYCWCSSSA